MKISRENFKDKCKYKVWNDYESRIIGGATLQDSSQPILLENINVQRNRRDRGIGSKLLNKILSDYDNSEIVAWVFEARVDWYQRHGFEKEDKSEDLVKVRKAT